MSQMVDKELQYLLENSCQLKRKLEVWRKRNAEQSTEAELLRIELEKLLERSKEDRHVHQTFHSVEKELRSRQTEKVNMRTKLDVEKTRNEQLVGELATLKEGILLTLSKTKDDKVLIEALKSQQGNLYDLLERQKLISESDNRRFRDNLGEIQAKHATNNNTLSYLSDVVEEKSIQLLQECLKQKGLKYDSESLEKKESTVTSLTSDSEQTQQSEPQQQSPASDASGELNEERAANDNEETMLAEECEQHRNILGSLKEEINQLRTVVLSNNERLNEWMSQLFQSKSLLSQKIAEVRDLEAVSKMLQKSGGKKTSFSPQHGSTFVEEMQKISDVLKEEYLYLLCVRQLILSNEENSMEIYLMTMDGRRGLFVEAINNLLTLEDDTVNAVEKPVDVEDEEKSEHS